MDLQVKYENLHDDMTCVAFSVHTTFSSGQWIGPLDLYGKEEDAPASHESPRYR